MIPKKPKEIAEKIAASRGIPADDMMDMVNGYYDTIKGMMRGLEHYRIKIRGLGEFKINDYRVMSAIPRVQRELYRLRKGYKDDELVELLDKLYRAQEWRAEERKKEEESKIEWERLKAKRQRDETEGDTNAGMEEQG
jgi:hypothetical protein